MALHIFFKAAVCIVVSILAVHHLHPVQHEGVGSSLAGRPDAHERTGTARRRGSKNRRSSEHARRKSRHLEESLWECADYTVHEEDCDQQRTVNHTLYVYFGEPKTCGCECCMTDSEIHTHSDHLSSAYYPMVFILVAFFVSASTRTLDFMLPPWAKFPHTGLLFLFGLCAEAFVELDMVQDWEITAAINMAAAIDPHVILLCLPPLLYEDASKVPWHVMHRVIPSALVLAIPGVLVNTVLTACLVKYTFFQWTWPAALVLGSILSATDPIAVVRALEELHAPEHLALLIAGESLFNDGSAVVFFNLFTEICEEGAEHDWDTAYSIGYFFQMGFGGPLMGLAFAVPVYLWLKHGSDNFKVEMLLVLLAVWGSFFLAEHPQVEVSGILAVVTFGFFMASSGRYRLAMHAEHDHHAVLEYIAMLANEALFFIAGLVAYRYASSEAITVHDWWMALWLYVIIHITRFATIVLFWPLLKRLGYGLHWKELVICVFGGLRGAVGLAMALIFEQDEQIDEDTRQHIAFHVSGVVVLTLFVNGLLVRPLYSYLQVYPVQERQNVLDQINLIRVEVKSHKYNEIVMKEWFFHGTSSQVLAWIPSFTHFIDVPDCAVDGDTLLSVRIANMDEDLDIQEDMARQMSLASEESHTKKRASTVRGSAVGASEHELISSVDNFMRSSLQVIMGQDPIRRYAAKLHASVVPSRVGLNRFLPTRVFSELKDSQETDAIVTHLMRMRFERFAKSSKGKAQREMMKDMTTSQLSVFRWKKALESWRDMKNQRVKIELLRINKIHQQLVQSITPAAVSTVDLMHRRMLYRSVFMSINAAFKEMFDCGVLDIRSFTRLRDSLNFGIESCEGLVRGYRFLDELPATRDLHLKPCEHQLRNCFLVSWAMIKSCIGKYFCSQTTSISSSNLKPLQVLETVLDVFKARSVRLRWNLLKRDVDMMLVIVVVYEHLLRVLPVFTAFPEIKVSVQEVVENIKCCALYGLLREQPVLWTIYEHICLVRACLLCKMAALMQIAETGTMPRSEAEKFSNACIKPTLQALAAYVPSHALLNDTAHDLSWTPVDLELEWNI